MGLNIKDLIVREEIEISDLKGKVLAVDTFNILYQFLTTIRQPDGSPLYNKDGKVTSHLNGLFFRTAKLLKSGIKLVFVFDGEAPVLKKAERERRKDLKKEAKEKYDAAKKTENFEDMKKYASRTAYLTGEMVDQAKELIELMGMPIIQAPAEGEAQVAQVVNSGNAYAAVSQDYDTLLYGCPRLIHNLSIAGKKKKTKLAYKIVKPSIITLKQVLDELGIDKDQMIMLSILVGTDYNKGGVKGIGPKNAIKLVKEYKGKYDKMFEKVEFDKHCAFSWKEIYKTFKDMPVKKDYELKFKRPQLERLKKFLVEKHNFAENRIENSLKELIKQKNKQEQKSLLGF